MESPRVAHDKVIETYKAHPLVREGFYYTMPFELLKAVKKHLNTSELDPAIWDMDLALGAWAGDHSWICGLFCGTPLTYSVMQSPPLSTIPVDQEIADVISGTAGASIDRTRGTLKSLDEKLNWARHSDHAYRGWLLTNRLFVREHDASITTWGNVIAREGIPTLVSRVPGSDVRSLVPRWTPVNEETKNFLRAYVALLHRWRLKALAGPRLPVPIPYQEVVVRLPPHVLDQTRLVSTPKALPQPPGDLAVRWADEAAASALREEHLAEWRAMAARNKTGKQALVRHVRLFRLQHFWRVLHERHGAACRNRKDQLTHAFTGFFGMKHDTLRGDLRLITQRLGADWYARAKPGSAARLAKRGTD